jgi:phosphoribosylaminoimidazole-succinocarboxamide synthase
MSRRRQIYEGKAKILYEGPEPGTIIQYFKDDATAFNAQKRGTISGKGVINNRISELIFSALANIGVPTHFIRRLNMREQLVRQVEIIPIEVVVRNVAAGSLSKRLGIEEGTQLPRTIIEYYYKDDALGDPMIADEHIACFGWASQDEMNDIADMAIRVNDFMCGLFAAIGIRLIDFKLEFGRVWENDQPRRLPPVGHEVERKARQGPLPPGPRPSRGSLSGSRPPPRPVARGGRRDRCPRPRQPPQEAGQVARAVCPGDRRACCSRAACRGHRRACRSREGPSHPGTRVKG